MTRIHLMDTNRSHLTVKEISQFTREITRQKNSPVCDDLSTVELARIGAKYMEADHFQLVKGQLDV